MSFLAGRLAATQGAFFLQESKHAAGRLAQKLPPSAASPPANLTPTGEAADVLPEILRHSIPIKKTAIETDPSLSTGSKWLIQNSNPSNSSSVYSEALNPLRAYVSFPQATFGPKRWQIPIEQPQFSASTANELRRDKYHPPVDSEKLKAVIAGYSQMGKAFAVATMIVFGGATVVFLYTANKLELHTADDIRNRGRDAIQPRVDLVRERIDPIKTWAENMSRKWHVEGNGEAKEKSNIIKQLSKAMGAKTSS